MWRHNACFDYISPFLSCVNVPSHGRYNVTRNMHQLSPLVYSLGLSNSSRRYLFSKSRTSKRYDALIKQGDSRCKMSGAALHSNATFRGSATWYTNHVCSTVLTTVLCDPLLLLCHYESERTERGVLLFIWKWWLAFRGMFRSRMPQV
jgi:hypothetical protein